MLSRRWASVVPAPEHHIVLGEGGQSLYEVLVASLEDIHDTTFVHLTSRDDCALLPKAKKDHCPQPAAKQWTKPQATKQPVKAKATARKSCPAGSDLKSQGLTSSDGAGSPRPYRRDIVCRDSGIRVISISFWNAK